MLRLVVFFLAALVLTSVLRHAPLVGGLFQVPLIGFWLSAALLSLGLHVVMARVLTARRHQRAVRDLGGVDTPANRGKLGALLLTGGDSRAAIPHLEAALAGEPARAEWAYRLGEARLASGDAAGAVAALDPLLARDEEHAYGRALLLSAAAATLAGQPEDALGRLDRYDRSHGPSPESAFERGRAHRAAGRRGEARAAFGEVARLASEAARFKRGAHRALVWRAWLARWV
ncbi:MAG: tetratricopeptide repeat protein [Planctomycetota bacterium]